MVESTTADAMFVDAAPALLPPAAAEISSESVDKLRAFIRDIEAKYSTLGPVVETKVLRVLLGIALQVCSLVIQWTNTKCAILPFL